MSRQAILNKIAEKMDEDSLLKLAADVLSEDDIISLSPPAEEPAWLTAVKEAASAHGAPVEFQEKLSGETWDSIKNTASQGYAGAKAVGSSMVNAAKHLGGSVEGAKNIPGAGYVPGVTTPFGSQAAKSTDTLSARIPAAASHVYNTVLEHPGPALGLAAGGTAAAVGAYLLAKKMGLIGQQEPEHGKTVMASAPLTDEQLTKLAQDPIVVGALHTLLRNGLL